MEKTVLDEKNMARFYLELLNSEDDPVPGEKPALTAPDRESWRQGLPALKLASPEINADSIISRLMSVALACLKWQPGPRLLPEGFPTALADMAPSERSELGTALFSGYAPGQKERWAAHLGVEPGMLDFLGRQAARPFLKSFARAVAGELNLDDWGKGYCPVCGDLPGMSRLAGEDGARKLYCQRCETEWRYVRIGCPYCGNLDSSTLSYLEIEGYGQYRLYLCDCCKSYLKTVDERKTGETDLFCADLATYGLDRLALAEGYRRG